MKFICRVSELSVRNKHETLEEKKARKAAVRLLQLFFILNNFPHYLRAVIHIFFLNIFCWTGKRKRIENAITILTYIFCSQIRLFLYRYFLQMRLGLNICFCKIISKYCTFIVQYIVLHYYTFIGARQTINFKMAVF
jgi:hypothetical protein